MALTTGAGMSSASRGTFRSALVAAVKPQRHVLQVMMSFSRRVFVALISYPVVFAANSVSFSTGHWTGILANGSGVLQSLSPSSDATYDFTASDFFNQRSAPGQYHTGDIALRFKVGSQTSWTDIDTAALRSSNPINTVPHGSLLHSDFSKLSVVAGKISLTRDWVADGKDLVLKATVRNPSSSETLQLGSFGFPLEFNNIFNNRTADEVTAKCNLIDPYVGLDAGFARVVRLTGTGPALVLTPYGNQSHFEAWRFLPEVGGAPFWYQTTGFEGLYSWEILTQAYAEEEWKAVTPWNPPTSLNLKPGASVTFGLRFSPVTNIYDIDSTIASVGLPVAVGVPGYIVPKDVEAKLFLDSKASVSSISVTPAGALTITPSAAKSSNWRAYIVKASPSVHGRVRVAIAYSDGKTQTVHYFVTEASVDTLDNNSKFLFDKAWYTNTSDPFKRAPSVIAYDNEAGAQVTQEQRVWIAGIADEAGSVYEAAALKNSARPDAQEVHKLEQMANVTVWGGLQVKSGSSKYGVKRSLFFYQPNAVPNYPYSTSIDWSGSWDKADSYAIWRAYDYVHASSLYYSLYRAERVSPGILTIKSALWYLKQAYYTALASQAKDKNGNPVTAYADVGLMGETMWASMLADLKFEGLTEQANTFEAAMKSREVTWATQSSPFGSEMVWDSTGQEPIYAWAKYFNNTQLQQKTLNSIRGYMPTVPHWGWNGNARRYWDFVFGGKLQRIERMIHHYGSSLNAIPLLDAYIHSQQENETAAFYDLRVGYGGHMGSLTNVDETGFSSTAFHSFPDTLKWDGYTGDYGPNMLGHVEGACSFLVDHSQFGWVGFGGNVQTLSGKTILLPRDAVRRCVYLEPLGLQVKIFGGLLSQATISPGGRVSIRVEKSAGSTATTTQLQYESTRGCRVSVTSKLNTTIGSRYSISIPTTIDFTVLCSS